MANTVTTYHGIAQMLWRTLNSRGLDPERLFHRVNLQNPNQYKVDDRVQAIAMQQLWRIAVEHTQDDAFGIYFAQQFQPTALHGLGFSWLSSDTLKDALVRLVRYYRLITSAGEIIFEPDSNGYFLWHKIPAAKGVAAPASLDAALAMFVQMCRITKDEHFCPTRVELQSNPENKKPFEQFFRCPIGYDAMENRLFFDLKTLEAPLPGANPALARANDQVVIDYLQHHDKSDIVSQIRANIIEALPSGTPSQPNIAAQVNLSTRSMQRKLKESHTSFKAIVEDTRKELALAYLKDGMKSIGEVTYMLGFTEPSNFTRSFKKWTGLTPADYQAN